MVVALNTAGANIDTLMGWQKNILATGGLIMGIGIAAITGGTNVGIAVGASVVAGSYPIGSELILDEYAQDILNIGHMVDFVNSVESGEITITVETIEDEDLDMYGLMNRLGQLDMPGNRQKITICDSQGVCQTFTTSASPANQRLFHSALDDLIEDFDVDPQQTSDPSPQPTPGSSPQPKKAKNVPV